MSEISEVMGGFLHPLVQGLLDADMFNKNYQFNADGSKVASGDVTFLFSGPPVLRPATPYKGSYIDYLLPIGGIQNYNLNQGQNLIPFKELGSKLNRLAMGSGNYGASFGRVENKHSGLKWSLYQWLPKFLQLNKPEITSLNVGIRPGANNNANNPVESIRQFVGLDSDLFTIPFGLLCITGSAGGRMIHLQFLEACYIQANNRSASAGNPLIIPSMSVSVTRVLPFIDTQGKSLLAGSEVNGMLKNFRTTQSYVI